MTKLWRWITSTRWSSLGGLGHRRFLAASASALKPLVDAGPPTSRMVGKDEVEEALGRIHQMTSNPPPKKKKKKDGGSVDQVVEYERVFRAYPEIEDLPGEVLNLSYPRIGRVLFSELDASQNFLTLYNTRFGTEPAKFYKLTYYGANRQVEKCRVAAVQEVCESSLAPEFRHIKRVIGVGEGTRSVEAKRAARIDLAERLHRVLADAGAMKTAKGAESIMDETFIRVGLRAESRSLLKDCFQSIDEDSTFAVEPPGKMEKAARPISGRMPLPGLPETIVLPKRLEKHPLPVCQQYEKIIRVIDSNRVTIVSAATGSGKTTQIPQFILEQYAGTGARPSVVVTQPRRIAAKSVARRVAEERGERIDGGGSAIGYSVRFDSVYPRRTEGGSVLFCTSGILLRRLHDDPELSQVTHLILDEVHERDVFTDLLLLITKRLLKRRPDLKVILMSATMQVDRIVDYFREDGHSVGLTLDIEGTNYPVEEFYLQDVVERIAAPENVQYIQRVGEISEACKSYIQAEIGADGDGSTGSSSLVIEDSSLKSIPYELVVALIGYIHAEKGPGAILCFLPGWEEMSQTHRLLTPHSQGLAIHLVHSSAPVSSADEIFKPAAPGTRKLILATNIAESSITIPDVVYVLDVGKQKIMHYDQRHRMNMLESSWISKANLRQRLGRAGRCRPGEYYSFMAEGRAARLPEQTPPELLRLGLDEVCLGLKAMGMKDSCKDILVTALDPPERLAVTQSVERLVDIGAMEEDESLTPLGKLLANIPVNPAFGRMLILAALFRCFDPVLSVVAGLGERIFKPARLPHEKADLHRFYAAHGPSLHSDHLLVHRTLQTWQQSSHGSSSPVSVMAMRRVGEIRRNLERLVRDNLGGVGEDWNENSGNENLVRFIIASGFYPDVAMAKSRRNAFQLRRLREVKIPHGSSNHDPLPDRTTGRSSSPRRPAYYVYEDLIDLGVKYIMKTTAIDPMIAILLAKKIQQADCGPASIKVDDWLAVQPDGNPEDLALLSELRVHLGAYLQWILSKKLAGKPLDGGDEEARKRLEQALLAVLAHSDIHRPHHLRPPPSK